MKQHTFTFEYFKNNSVQTFDIKMFVRLMFLLSEVLLKCWQSASGWNIWDLLSRN